jgi:hypothetical protein
MFALLQCNQYARNARRCVLEGTDRHIAACADAALHLPDHVGVAAGPLAESAARRLLLAQLRASMHPSKLLLVLAAPATNVRRYAFALIFCRSCCFLPNV